MRKPTALDLASHRILVFIISTPKLADRLRTEFARAFVTEQSLPNVDFLTKECPLLDATFRETLRLATAPSSMRLVEEDTEIGGFTFYKGDRVLLPSMHLHRAKHFWGEDADSFRPERMLEIGDRVDIVQSGFLVRSGCMCCATLVSQPRAASVRRRVVVLPGAHILPRRDHVFRISRSAAVRFGAHGPCPCSEHRPPNVGRPGPAYAVRPQTEARTTLLNRRSRHRSTCAQHLWDLKHVLTRMSIACATITYRASCSKIARN